MLELVKVHNSQELIEVNKGNCYLFWLWCDVINILLLQIWYAAVTYMWHTAPPEGVLYTTKQFPWPDLVCTNDFLETFFHIFT